MRAIALGLDLDEMFFEDKINEQYHNFRLLSYPSVKTSLLPEGHRAGAHSGGFSFRASQWERNSHTSFVDYGTLTLLFQDNVGGLEVENPRTKEFQPAKPIVCVRFFIRANSWLSFVSL
jgi:isopenicillin N synthase-like dioxygenase